MALIPQALDQLKGNDASFETSSSSSIQNLKLYYVFNVVTKSLGLVLYHNRIYDDKLIEELQNKRTTKFNVVVPSAKMLEDALKLDRVHTFGDLSEGQLFEKMDHVTEWASLDQKSTHGEKE